MNLKKINAALYGDGSRRARLRAEYIFCNRADECSLYKSGKCFNVTTLFGGRCPTGELRCVDGGTKQSKKYHDLWLQVKNDDCYGKLKYPSHEYIGRIGDDAYLHLPYVVIDEKNGRLTVSDAIFSVDWCVMNRKILTPENLDRICRYRPETLMGGENVQYQEKIVPNFLHQLSLLFSDEYEALISECPEYAEKKPNFVGRIAKLVTCNPSCEYKDTNKNVFYFEEDWFVCDCYNSAFAPFRAKGAALKIQATDEMLVEITDNAQVLPETELL